MCSATLDLLLKFQTALVGLVGFAGVILTLVVNSRIARRQVQDQRRHDRLALQRALLAELESQRETITNNIADIEKRAGEEYEGMYHPRLLVPIFDASIPRLGLVDDAGLPAILHGFQVIRGFNRRLSFIAEPHGDTDFLVPENRVKTLAGMLKTTLPAVDKAIEALSKP